ncbi:MAG: ABC transporter ATP-binding protein [Oscillospiraceae bacterium]|nr:ABC transporter ATP-binding protein [Oscillospiraceae bacterium]
MSESIIKTKGLTKTYGKNDAVNDFTIDISGERIIGLIGRNGAGKTTLMKMIAGQLDISGGELEVLGEAPMDNLNVLNNLVYTYHNMDYEKARKLRVILESYAIMFDDFDLEFATKLLEYFGLNPKLKYKQLSQGMASIFNFICGISCRTRLVMLDEPVLGMDVTVRRAAYEVLLREFSENPRLFIVSSHLLSEIEGILSDIILIDNGRLVLFDNIDELRESAYRVEGEKDAVEKFTAGKNVVYTKSGFSAEAVIYEPLTETVTSEAKELELTISTVRAEDICIYLTKENKEGELECLWQKAN